MAYVGLSLAAGASWPAYNPSPRFGGLLGWRVTEMLSLNIEGDLDYVRLYSGPRITNDAECGGGSSNFWCGFIHPPRHSVDITFSPLMSFRAGQIRLGPKIGWFVGKNTDQGMPATSRGFVAGLNAGLFVPYRGVTLGGLVSVSLRHIMFGYCPDGAYHTVGLTGAILL
jgi:hypothetical protein